MCNNYSSMLSVQLEIQKNKPRYDKNTYFCNTINTTTSEILSEKQEIKDFIIWF